MIHCIPIQSGASLTLDKGEKLQIWSEAGTQVSDLLLFNKADIREKLSSGKTLDFEESLLITAGHHLWSNRCNKMARITRDDNGRNDFLLAPCSQETFEIMYGHVGHHPSCFENLHTNLSQYGIQPDDIPNAFNVFMNVQWNEAGKVSVLPPTNTPGQILEIEALMDLIVGLTACSALDSNGGSFKTISYQKVVAAELETSPTD